MGVGEPLMRAGVEAEAEADLGARAPLPSARMSRTGIGSMSGFGVERSAMKAHRDSDRHEDEVVGLGHLARRPAVGRRKEIVSVSSAMRTVDMPKSPGVQEVWLLVWWRGGE